MLHFDLNNDWLFSKNSDMSEAEKVRLPHSNCILPYNYTDEKDYQFVSYYSRKVEISPDWLGKNIFINFDGVAHGAEVYFNDTLVMSHNCGYTGFAADVSKYAIEGANDLRVVVDSRESQNIPPFGNVIDYLTYGGIYREVSLEIAENNYIADVFVRGFAESQPYNFQADVTLNAFKEDLSVKYTVKQDGQILLSNCEQLSSETLNIFAKVDNVKLWSIEQPNLAEITVEIVDGEVILDERTVKFGFRTAKFTEKGFFLNGKKIKIVGLNRHQSYPYVGYAMPERVQRRDAYLLKNQLCVNAVRTSHYPQSKHFIDACDELGLLVFTEIPGWQHIGDAQWQEVALNNVKEMVNQYRNHPSIILWGVRINESLDDDELYVKTNALARELDETRQTGGVRYLRNSHLFEEVYTYNDFSHVGNNRGTAKKSQVTKIKRAPYLVTEFNGHMYPTKSFDDEAHRTEHALRHARVVNSYCGDDKLAGGFGWCMFDYNTHKDFGAGDKICYHGVMDMFRNNKLAAYLYASQGNAKNVLEVSSTMDKGDYPAASLSRLYVFTNADSVRMYRNDELIKVYLPINKKFANLAHPPIEINDFIGNLLEKQEGFKHGNAEICKRAINNAMRNSGRVSGKDIFGLIKVLISEGLSYKKLFDICYKYGAGWGTETVTYRFDAVKESEVVKSVYRRAVDSVNLDVTVDTKQLVEGSTYDVASVNIRAVDFFGNVLPYYNDAVELKATGAIELIGANVISLKGGMGGTYVKSKGDKGKGTLTVRGAGGDKTIKFTVE